MAPWRILRRTVSKPPVVDLRVEQDGSADPPAPVGRLPVPTMILVVISFGVATAVMMSPISLHPATYVSDLGDPALFAWMLSWMSKAIVTSPLDLFQANSFYPFADSLAFTDAPLGIVPIAGPIIWLTGNPILAVNIAGLAGFWFSGLAAFLLTWHLTRRVGASAVAGVVFAFSPYQIGHLGHLQLLTAYWIPLALLFLHRGVEGGRWRDFGGFGICFAMQAISSIYYVLFLAFAVTLFAGWFAALSPRRYAADFLLKLAIAGACAAAAILPYFRPYQRVRQTYRFERTLAEVQEQSADLRDYLTVPVDNQMGGLGYVGAGEHTLYPGLTSVLYASIGLFIGRHRGGHALPTAGRGATPTEPRRRLGPRSSGTQGYYLALAACAFVLSLGPTLKSFGYVTNVRLPYTLFFEFVPGFDSIRAVARFAVLVNLGLAVLAGEGVARLERSLPDRPADRWGKASLCAIIISATMSEYASFPLRFSTVRDGTRLPEVYRWLDRQDPGVVVVELPIESDLDNARYQYFSSFHRRKIVNGYSGFYPEPHQAIRRILREFPAGDSVGLLRELGVDFVIIHGSTHVRDYFRALISRTDAVVGLHRGPTFDDIHVYRIDRCSDDGGIGEAGTGADLSDSTRELLSQLRSLSRAANRPVRPIERR